VRTACSVTRFPPLARHKARGPGGRLRPAAIGARGQEGVKMRNKFLLVALFSCLLLTSVAYGEDYKEVVMFSNGTSSTTVEDFSNTMAGPNGEYSFFKPELKYKNKNYDSFGVKISNDDYDEPCLFYLCINKKNMIVDHEESIYYGKKNLKFAGFLPVENDSELYNWVLDRYFRGNKLLYSAYLSAFGVDSIYEEFKTQREILSWYTTLDQIRTKTCDDKNPAEVVVNVVLGYKKDDKNVSTEITERRTEIVDFLKRYFSSKTEDELSPDKEEMLKNDIRDKINNEILLRSKIRDVRFTTKDVIKP